VKTIPSDYPLVPIEKVLLPMGRGRLLQQGWSPQCLREASDKDETWGVLKTTAIQAGEFRAEHNKRLPDHLDPRPELEVRPGDLLLTCAGPRSRCGVATLVRKTRPRLMISGKMYRFRVDEKQMDAQFLEYYLLSPVAQDAIDRMKTGVSDSGLNLTHARFLRLPVPQPSLTEQRRIVAVLEGHLSRLDAALLSVAKAKARATQLVRNVLFTRIDEGASDRHPLGELVREGMRNGHSARASSDGSGIRTLTLTAVTASEFTEANTKLTVADPDRVRDLWLEPGDILVERSNTPDLVGTAARFDGPREWAIFPDLLIRVRADESRVLSTYLDLVLHSPASRQFLTSRAKGLSGSMPKIDQGTLAALPIPVPSLTEQAQIVEEIDTITSECQRVEVSSEYVNTRTDALRRSLMGAAFSGRLALESSSV